MHAKRGCYDLCVHFQSQTQAGVGDKREIASSCARPTDLRPSHVTPAFQFISRAVIRAVQPSQLASPSITPTTVYSNATLPNQASVRRPAKPSLSASSPDCRLEKVGTQRTCQRTWTVEVGCASCFAEIIGDHSRLAICCAGGGVVFGAVDEVAPAAGAFRAFRAGFFPA